MSYDGLCLTTEYMSYDCLLLPSYAVIYFCTWGPPPPAACTVSVLVPVHLLSVLSCASSGRGEKIKDTPSSVVILANNWRLCMSRRYPINIEFSRI